MRKRFSQLLKAIRKIQGWIRTMWARTYFLKMRKQVVKIQRMFRRKLLKQNVAQVQWEKLLAQTDILPFRIGDIEIGELFGTNVNFQNSNEISELEFNKWAKYLAKPNPNSLFMLPPAPEIELNAKGKLFSLLIDLSVQLDTTSIYNRGWNFYFKTLLTELNKRGERVLHVFPGESATFVVTDDLGVYAFGSNEHNQLGAIGRSKEHCHLPFKLQHLSRNKLLQFCGRNQTYSALT